MPTYTYDPTQVDVVSQIRFRIQDTDVSEGVDSARFSDEEITHEYNRTFQSSDSTYNINEACANLLDAELVDAARSNKAIKLGSAFGMDPKEVFRTMEKMRDRFRRMSGRGILVKPISQSFYPAYDGGSTGNMDVW
jgi:hypothetical protein